MIPPVPPRLSTTTLLPAISDILAATMRAMMSTVPPAANGTMRRMGRSGYISACAADMQASAKTKARIRIGGLICGPRRPVDDLPSVGGSGARRSDQHRTIHGDAMHQPPQRQLIVADRQVLGHAVVPHQQVSEAPSVPVAKLRPRDHVRELLDEGQALL